MRGRTIVSVLLVGLFILCTAGVSSAAGRNSVTGNGTRDYQDLSGNTFTATFSFDVVIKGGNVSGTFSWDNGQGLSFSGAATCGSVNGNVAVFGGQVTDSFGSTENAVFEVSEKPDGVTVGEGSTTPCDTSNFGGPIPITTGSVKITGPH